MNSELNDPGLSPGWGHCVVFMGKTFFSHSASLHRGVQNIVLVRKCWGITLDGLACHPRVNRSTLSHLLCSAPPPPPPPLIKFTGTHLYTWVERSTVRIKYLAQEHNAGDHTQGLNLDHSITPGSHAQSIRPLCHHKSFEILVCNKVSSF